MTTLLFEWDTGKTHSLGFTGLGVSMWDMVVPATGGPPFLDITAN
jgi:hypothetical protein